MKTVKAIATYPSLDVMCPHCGCDQDVLDNDDDGYYLDWMYNGCYDANVECAACDVSFNITDRTEL